ncbi:MAG: trehalose-phosphatase [Actinomycetota bacterium]|nr:trehalose-phosphatase [Actinomycetota bacterium]
MSDFDGTLAPIVDEPDQAVALGGVVDALGELTEHFPLVGVISGRPVAYLLERLAPAPKVTLVGLYGLERASHARVDQLPAAGGYREKVEEAAVLAEKGRPEGAKVERKGLAVTLHIRGAPSLAGWMEATAATVSDATGLVAYPGRQSVELRPPVDADKGTVLTELADSYQSVCFIGDDKGDLPAFAALAALRGRGVTTVAVAVTSPEMPPELAVAADVTVDGPEGVLEVLRYLASAKSPSLPANEPR